MTDKQKLTFSAANTKTRKLAKVLGVKGSELWGFSLPAGWTCPYADKCLSKADPDTGKLTDGPACEYRCFAASMEAMYPSLRDMVWRNLQALRAVGVNDRFAMRDLILESMPAKAKVVRVHVSGDFFNAAYLHAWIMVAQARPGVIFYAYTKSLKTLLPFVSDLPANLRITYSYGGKCDGLIDNGFSWPTAYVVHTPQEAADRGLPIDHKDSMAFHSDHDFALLIHGPQPKGTDAAKAARANRGK